MLTTPILHFVTVIPATALVNRRGSNIYNPKNKSLQGPYTLKCILKLVQISVTYIRTCAYKVRNTTFLPLEQISALATAQVQYVSVEANFIQMYTNQYTLHPVVEISHMKYPTLQTIVTQMVSLLKYYTHNVVRIWSHKTARFHSEDKLIARQSTM